jgi:hypothetical protein
VSEAVALKVSDIDSQRMTLRVEKQSGIGREFGTFGLDAFLEPRAVLS